MNSMISIIIPAFQEESSIESLLHQIAQDPFPHEVIVADGGSSDRTVERARPLARVISAPRGRGLQMNEGAKAALGTVLLFLHADCWIEPGTLSQIDQTIKNGFVGGCLNQKIRSGNPIYRLLEWTGHIRARFRKIFYGDQGIFVRRDIFVELSGFKPWPLFEDIDFSKRLRKKGWTKVLSKRVYISDRRWRKQGILKTTLVNRWLLMLYRLGYSPEVLSRRYHDIR